jgi:hypothetical protein
MIKFSHLLLTLSSAVNIIIYSYKVPPDTPVLAGPEPSNQRGKKVMFLSQNVERMGQLRLWVPWVPEGYIHPFPTFAVRSGLLLFTFKNSARTTMLLLPRLMLNLNKVPMLCVNVKQQPTLNLPCV